MTVGTVTPKHQRFHPRSETGSLLTWTQSTTAKNSSDHVNNDADETSSQYSDAQVVDVKDLIDVPSASERLGKACAEALDMKPSRAKLARKLIPIIADCIGEGESLYVARWALNDAWFRCEKNALEELSVLHSLSYNNLSSISAKVTPPEPIVRFVCAEMGAHNALATATALKAARKWHTTQASKSTRVLRVHIPFPVAVLGVVCALARTQCNVAVRGRNHFGHSAFLRANLGRVRINVDIVGSEPVVVVVQRQVAWFSVFSPGGREIREHAEELVTDVSDILSEFASVAVLGS